MGEEAGTGGSWDDFCQQLGIGDSGDEEEAPGGGPSSSKDSQDAPEDAPSTSKDSQEHSGEARGDGEPSPVHSPSSSSSDDIQILEPPSTSFAAPSSPAPSGILPPQPSPAPSEAPAPSPASQLPPPASAEPLKPLAQQPLKRDGPAAAALPPTRVPQRSLNGSNGSSQSPQRKWDSPPTAATGGPLTAAPSSVKDSPSRDASAAGATSTVPAEPSSQAAPTSPSPGPPGSAVKSELKVEAKEVARVAPRAHASAFASDASLPAAGAAAKVADGAVSVTAADSASAPPKAQKAKKAIGRGGEPPKISLASPAPPDIALVTSLSRGRPAKSASLSVKALPASADAKAAPSLAPPAWHQAQPGSSVDGQATFSKGSSEASSPVTSAATASLQYAHEKPKSTAKAFDPRASAVKLSTAKVSASGTLASLFASRPPTKKPRVDDRPREAAAGPSSASPSASTSGQSPGASVALAASSAAGSRAEGDATAEPTKAVSSTREQPPEEGLEDGELEDGEIQEPPEAPPTQRGATGGVGAAKPSPSHAQPAAAEDAVPDQGREEEPAPEEARPAAAAVRDDRTKEEKEADLHARLRILNFSSRVRTLCRVSVEELFQQWKSDERLQATVDSVAAGHSAHLDPPMELG